MRMLAVETEYRGDEGGNCNQHSEKSVSVEENSFAVNQQYQHARVPQELSKGKAGVSAASLLQPARDMRQSFTSAVRAKSGVFAVKNKLHTATGDDELFTHIID